MSLQGQCCVCVGGGGRRLLPPLADMAMPCFAGRFTHTTNPYCGTMSAEGFGVGGVVAIWHGVLEHTLSVWRVHRH